MVLENDQNGVENEGIFCPNRLGEVPFALAMTGVCNQSGLPSPRRRSSLLGRTRGLPTSSVFLFTSAKLSLCLSELLHLGEDIPSIR